MDNNKIFINDMGMKFICLEPGRFKMGQGQDGDPDEVPVHPVQIRNAFRMSTTPVTNAQYEKFDPAHKQFRGRQGLSKKDNEAVLVVSWPDAVRFCKWLSQKEGKPYRLPTEAEWEYACRAGTTTAYHTGDALPEEYWKNQKLNWWPKRIDLTVVRTPPNPWGLHDMHGLVEEWCHDWYGPYDKKGQTDPVGQAAGWFKVTRGGSHNTELKYLRSANRLGALPDDKHWMIGFRVVQGNLPKTKPLPAPKSPLCQSRVSQKKYIWSTENSTKPLFATPVPYITPPLKGSGTPFYTYQHCPAITWCPNGDLLVAWFTTNSERGRELTILAARRRAGQNTWDPASEFFKAPDRNMTGTSLFHDGRGAIYHANGMSVGDSWASQALVLRTSRDNGTTWTTPGIVSGHQYRNQVIAGMFKTKEGFLIQPCDAVYDVRGGSAIHISRDSGKTWTDPAAGTPHPQFKLGATGGTITGIHTGVVQLTDGRLMALGRGNNIAGHMPMSISEDMGKTWTYHRTEFPPVSSCQRLVLLHLREGPLLLVSFTDPLASKHPRGIAVKDAAGKKRKIVGLYAALSMDDGRTWPIKRLITDDRPARTMPTLDGKTFTLSTTTAEPAGYLAATQTPDKIIHLVSSFLYYRFNLAWLKTLMPEEASSYNSN